MATEHSYDYIVTPYPEYWAKKLHVAYPILWGLFSGALFCLQLGTLLLAGERERLICSSVWPYVALSLLPAILAITIVRFSKILEDFSPSLMSFVTWPKEKALDWYSGQVRKIFDTRRMCIVGLCFICSLLYVTLNSPVLPSATAPRIVFLIIMLAIQFFGGGMLYVMWHIARMIRELGQIDAIKISVYQHPMSSVKAVGVLMAKVAFTIVLIYLFGISYSMFCTPTKAVLATNFIFGLIVLFFFIFPQMEIHRLMVKVKHQRLIQFSGHLENALQQVAENPSGEAAQHVKELFDIQNSLNEMGEWPFNTKMFMTIFTGIAVPLLAVLLQIACQWIEKVVSP